MLCQIPSCTSKPLFPCDFCDKVLCPAHCNTYGPAGDVCCADCLAIGGPYLARIAASAAGHEDRVRLEMDGWRGAVVAGAREVTL